ncbi:hypothetical protein [Rothia nasimurium]|uniref:hypothetical protein n=1 Tax=Rothia nasimurium TaxID=85336 RepID=UPI002DD6AF06|nr:hypothetical protein [Rothia nasimurium]
MNQEVYPKTEGILKCRLAVGGSPESVARAAQYKTPLKLAIIGGSTERFKPYTDLYCRANEQLGINRFNLKFSNGALAHEHSMNLIDLYGTKVLPRVRELLAED